MNVKIGTRAVQFPEKEHMNGIFVAVQAVDITLCMKKCNINYCTRPTWDVFQVLHKQYQLQRPFE